MAEATLSSKNQIVIPKEAREALGLKPGDKLLVTIRDGHLIVLPKPRSYRGAIRGLLKDHPFPKDYLKKERASWR
jgi:AbrB family looped-hinge helix DNA binding protein